MSVDALTYTRIHNGIDVWGSHGNVRDFDVALSTAYPATGYTMVPKDVGLTALISVQDLGTNNVGYWTSFVPTSMPLGLAGGTLHIYLANGTELTTNSDYHTVVMRLRFKGE